MLIKNVSLLYGKDLEYLRNNNVIVNDNVFGKINTDNIASDDDVYDAEGLLMIPGLINAHTHIADSIAKDIASDEGLDKRVHPVYGVKRAVLNESVREHLVTYMQASVLSMLKRGITTFADFREGGLDGINLLKEAVTEMGIRHICLGRVEHYFNMESIQRNDDLPEEVLKDAETVIDASDGFGISGANEYSNKALGRFQKIAREHNKLLAIHAAESREVSDYSMKNFGKSETSRIIEHLLPDFVVHMTNASDSDLKAVAEKNIGIIVCPRANGVLGAGIPKVASMIKHGCNVGIGTDNVMLNSPDLFRELDYLWKVSKAMENNFISARELVKMVTVNAANILKLDKLGYIDENMLADAVFIDTHSIDLDPMHDPYAAIVHRVNESNIKAVMIGGRFVHGSL